MRRARRNRLSEERQLNRYRVRLSVVEEYDVALLAESPDDAKARAEVDLRRGDQFEDIQDSWPEEIVSVEALAVEPYRNSSRRRGRALETEGDPNFFRSDSDRQRVASTDHHGELLAVRTACEAVRRAALSGRARQRSTIRGEMMEQQARDPVPRVVDHVGFAVADYKRSKAFYERALAPLGVTLLMEFAGAAAGFGQSGRPSFFIEAHGEPVRGRLHIALRAENRAQVDAFHAAALEAGGTDNGAPGVRAMYHHDYYGGYVLDPDGNNIEAVCHKPE